MKSNAKKVFKNLQKKFERVKQEAPKVLANEGQRVFLENFRTQSFDGKKWPDRAKKDKYNRPILIGKTRRLRNATATSTRTYNTKRIKWGNYLPYAAIHNFGEVVNRKSHSRYKTIKTKVRGSGYFENGKFKKGKSKTLTLQGDAYNVSESTFNMPKRTFMGIDNKFRKRLKDKFEQLYRKIK